jgi:predicted DNA-binding WGR domain protein/ribosomal protein L37AE/L43A
MKQRYEFIGGSSAKFWEVDTPFEVENKWAVRVVFGRLGTVGNVHVKLFGSYSQARIYYDNKVWEKKNKGYKLKMQDNRFSAGDPKKGLVAWYEIPKPNPKPIVKPCGHEHLHKKGENKWECSDCKSVVEFDKREPKTEAKVEEAKVRRFIDMKALTGA